MRSGGGGGENSSTVATTCLCSCGNARCSLSLWCTTMSICVEIVIFSKSPIRAAAAVLTNFDVSKCHELTAARLTWKKQVRCVCIALLFTQSSTIVRSIELLFAHRLHCT